MKQLKSTLALMGAAIGFGIASGQANAGIIFQDDFNRANSNTVGNGWYEDERNNNDVGIRNGHLRLRDVTRGFADAAAWQFESTVGYTDIYIDFDWGASYNTEPRDRLYLAFLPSGNFGDRVNVWSTGLGGSGFQSVSVGAIAGADNLSSFGLIFYTDVSARNEFAMIDNVVVRGTPVTAVTEPASLALLSLGMLGLGFARRQSS